jgi:hypothetical protein
VPAPQVLQLQFAAVAAELDRHLVAERLRRPRQPGNRVRLLEQSGHSAELGRPVLLAALGDQRPRVVMRDDHVRLERARPKHPHRVIVRQNQVPHRFVSVLAEFRQPLTRGDRRRQRLETDDEILAFDGPDIGVTLGGQRVHAVREYLEGLLFLTEIRG